MGQEIADASSKGEQHSSDETAIDKLGVAFDNAWNNRDAHGLSALFTKDGDFQYHTGLIMRGREEIEKTYSTVGFPKMPPDWRHTVTRSHLRFVRDDIAIADGTALITSAATPEKEAQLYLSVVATVVLVKEHENWYISVLRLMVPNLGEDT
jgi:uncharacterized protein (TIGR02246 family)